MENYKNKITVYIASAYTKGDVAVNVRRQLECADQLMTLGYAPFAPLYSHFQHMHSPRPYEDWIEIDKVWVLKCDCLLRLPGESSGADGEVELAKANSIPVFYSIGELQEYFPFVKGIDAVKVLEDILTGELAKSIAKENGMIIEGKNLLTPTSIIDRFYEMHAERLKNNISENISKEIKKEEIERIIREEQVNETILHDAYLQANKIARYQRIMKLAGVPEFLIDHPEFINLEPVTKEDLEWAEKVINKLKE